MWWTEFLFSSACLAVNVGCVVAAYFLGRRDEAVSIRQAYEKAFADRQRTVYLMTGKKDAIKSR